MGVTPKVYVIGVGMTKVRIASSYSTKQQITNKEVIQ